MTRVQLADLDWRGRPARIEYRWVDRQRHGQPLIVFLHEGLGSVDAWKDFPERICDAANARGLVYSRPGYGRSIPSPEPYPWPTDFLHQQAYEILPALLRVLDVQDQPWLFGHSDGASIALLYAARFPQSVAGLIVLGPHIFVEQYGLENIRQLRWDYVETDLRRRLARYHEDVDAAFWSWNEVWLDPDFERWSIEQELASVTCPVLAIQGLDDEYGTLEQIRTIARRLPQARLLELADCRHRAHRDQPERVIDAAARFVLEQPTEGLARALP
jgi:pimeloyl-ACP methyl ester carboxylesterase